MSKFEKQIKRLKSKPKDYKYSEAKQLLIALGYKQAEKGHASGSRIAFTGDGLPPIMLHKPHPSGELKDYQVKQIIEILEEEHLI